MVDGRGGVEHGETLLLPRPGSASAGTRTDAGNLASAAPRLPGTTGYGDCSHNAGQVKQRQSRSQLICDGRGFG